MKNINKWHIAVIALFLFILAPIALYWLVCTPNPWGWGFIKPEDTGAWLGFYGSVLGGVLTFGGVWWTIKDNREQKTEELKIQYKPIVLLSDSDVKDEKGYINNPKDSTNLTHGYFFLQLKNIGRGEAKNIKVELTANKEISATFFKLYYLREISVIGQSERMSYGIGIPLEYLVNYSLKDKCNIDLHALITYNGFKDDFITCEMDLTIYKSDKDHWSSDIKPPSYTNL